MSDFLNRIETAAETGRDRGSYDVVNEREIDCIGINHVAVLIGEDDESISTSRACAALTIAVSSR